MAEVNLPPPTSANEAGFGGGEDMDWFGLFGDALGGFGQLFGSPPSTSTRTTLRPPSMDELTLQAYGLDRLYNQGPNPIYAYGVEGTSDLLEGGMRASPEQLAYLDQIRRNQIDTGTRGVNEWLADARRTNLNEALARGMDQSSVELWGTDQSTKAALNRVADLISGANTQYAQGAVDLPYRTAGVYGDVAKMGQMEGDQAMTQLRQFLETLQGPRMAEASSTTTTTPGSADRAGAAGDLLGLLGPIISSFV